MKVGILKTDSVMSALVSAHGEYPEMFAGLLRTADPELEFETFDVREQLPPATNACDGWLITGSKLSVYDDVDWIRELGAFVRRLVAEKRKLVAICFGHQLVAHFCGGLTERAAVGWTIGLQRQTATNPFPWIDDGAADVALIHSHRDQVTQLPTGAVAVGGNERCPLGLYRIGDHVMSVQGHPEFSADYARDVYATRREMLGEETYAAALQSLESPADAAELARWIVAFLRY